MENEKRLIDPTEYASFLKRYIKELHEVDAPMIAGAVERCLQKLEAQPTVEAIVLPCAIGSTVYVIGHKYRAGCDECWINTGKFRPSDLEKIGDRVFLTYEEAKEKILSMNKGNSRFRFIEGRDGNA